MTITATPTATEELTQALSAWNEAEGWLYPADPEASLVRIRVEDRHYTIQRRRDPVTPWTLLVRSMIADFDPATFATWQNTWRLTLT